MNLEEPLSESIVLADYLPKLIRLAERNLSPQLRQKLDAEDVGATVVRTVLRQAREGKLRIEQSEDFWRLLVVITLNKVRKKARYFTSQKRDMRREAPTSDEGPGLADVAVDYRGAQEEPSQVEGDSLAEILERVSAELPEKAQQVLAGKLQGLSHLEIAESIGQSTKTVQRQLEIVKGKLMEIMQQGE